MGFSKQCSNCGRVKWWYEFSKRKDGKFSLTSFCKNCCREKDRKWYKHNSEKRKKSSHEWRKNHPEKASEYDRKWKKNNPEKVIKNAREHYRKNKKIISIKKRRKLKTMADARDYLNPKIADIIKELEALS